MRAVAILNAWSSTLTGIDGSSDKFLASGIYGYQLANAAEILRSYPKWTAGDRDRLQAMMLTIFYPMNHDFLVRHNGAKIDHYWANWDLANMASMLAIGVLTDRRDIYGEAVEATTGPIAVASTSSATARLPSACADISLLAAPDPSPDP